MHSLTAFPDGLIERYRLATLPLPAHAKLAAKAAEWDDCSGFSGNDGPVFSAQGARIFAAVKSVRACQFMGGLLSMIERRQPQSLANAVVADRLGREARYELFDGVECVGLK